MSLLNSLFNIKPLSIIYKAPEQRASARRMLSKARQIAHASGLEFRTNQPVYRRRRFGASFFCPCGRRAAFSYFLTRSFSTRKVRTGPSEIEGAMAGFKLTYFDGRCGLRSPLPRLSCIQLRLGCSLGHPAADSYKTAATLLPLLRE